MASNASLAAIYEQQKRMKQAAMASGQPSLAQATQPPVTPTPTPTPPAAPPQQPQQPAAPPPASPPPAPSPSLAVGAGAIPSYSQVGSGTMTLADVQRGLGPGMRGTLMRSRRPDAGRMGAAGGNCGRDQSSSGFHASKSPGESCGKDGRGGRRGTCRAGADGRFRREFCPSITRAGAA